MIQNVEGAVDTSALGRLARAAPMAIRSASASGALTSSMPSPIRCRVLHDFEPIALLAITPTQLIIARKNLPANNVKNWSSGSRPIRTSERSQRPPGACKSLRSISSRRLGRASRSCPSARWSGRRSGRYHVRSGRQRHRPGPNGTIKSHAVLTKDHVGAARCSIDRRGGRAVPVRLVLGTACGLRKGRQGHRRQAQRGGCQRLGRCERTTALCRIGGVWPRDQQTPEGTCGGSDKAETEKRWPIIRASNLRGRRSPRASRPVGAAAGRDESFAAAFIPREGEADMRKLFPAIMGSSMALAARVPARKTIPRVPSR